MRDRTILLESFDVLKDYTVTVDKDKIYLKEKYQ